MICHKKSHLGMEVDLIMPGCRRYFLPSAHDLFTSGTAGLFARRRKRSERFRVGCMQVVDAAAIIL